MDNNALRSVFSFTYIHPADRSARGGKHRAPRVPVRVTRGGALLAAMTTGGTGAMMADIAVNVA